jgi:hypothetical protein
MAFGAKGMGSMTIVQTSASVAHSNSLAICLFIVIAKPLPPKEGCRAVSRPRKRDNQQGRQICQNRTFLATLLLALSGVIVGGGPQWGSG